MRESYSKIWGVIGLSLVLLLGIDMEIKAQGTWGGNQRSSGRSWGDGGNRGWPSRGYGEGGNYPSGHYPSGNESGSDVNLNWLPGLIQGLGEIANEANRPQYRPQPQYVPQPQYYPQPNYVPQPVRQPTYVPPPKPRVATPSNAKPPEKIAQVQANRLINTGLEMIGATEFNLASEVVQQKAQESIKELETSLGDAAKDPEVEKILKEGADKVKNGEPLDDTWSDKLKDAVNAASGNPATQLPPGTNPAALDDIVNDIQGLSEANAILSQPFPPGGVAILVPSGPTNVVLFPALPQDDLVVLPDGSILLGTGGDGLIDVVNVDAAELLGIPVGIGDPEPESTADVAKRAKDGVLLMNPAANGVSVSYVVSNHDYSMKAGYTQQLAAGRTWEIRFDRGEGNGEAKYTLRDGTYSFGTSSNGWELYRKTFSVTINNSDNENAFRYVVDNAPQEIAAGGAKTHTSDYPIFVRFDRGDGKNEATKKISEKDYELKVAVNSADGLWDLYPGTETPTIASMEPPRAAEDRQTPVATGRTSRLRSLLKAAGR